MGVMVDTLPHQEEPQPVARTRKSTPVYVCAWCGTPVDQDTTWKSPVPREWGTPGVGYIVCQPTCAKRPPDTVVYTHDSLRLLLTAA